MKSKLSPAELFFGCRLASNLPIIHKSNPELVTERQPSDDDTSRTRSVNFEPNDNVWVCLSPLENVWKQGVVIRSVVGVPDSFVVDINGQQYRQNKHDLNLAHQEVKALMMLLVLRNKMEPKTELIDYDQDQH